MGCGSSKQVKAGAVDAYRPAPSSFAVFDINSIEEPWLKHDHHSQAPLVDDPSEKQKAILAVVPATVLEKLENADAPKSWEEVSKALETHLKKPTTTTTTVPSADTKPPSTASDQLAPLTKPPPTAGPPRKSFSFHTVEELEAKKKVDTAINQKAAVQLKKTESTRTETPTASTRTELTSGALGFRPVKENIFVVRDRLEREKEGNKKPAVMWDPLKQFPEKCPPGGSDGVVVYTTSLRGVRRTYEDCVRVREIMEQQGVVFEERDVSLDAGVLKELKELMTAEGEGPPRVFVKGRYLGGAEEVVAMNEMGKLGRVLRWARLERIGEEGRQTCDGCGGVRWLPCFECGGSCKVRPANADGWEKCGKCNENGLVRCPVCY